MWGVSASPVLHGDLCLLNFGPGDRTFLIAVRKKTGETIWQHEEPGGKADKYIGSWPTPLVINSGAREEVIISWPERVAGYELRNGAELWTCRGLNPLV